MDLRTLSRIALGFGIALVVSATSMLLFVPGAGGMSLGQGIVGLGLIVFYFVANKGALGRTFAGRGTLFYSASAIITVLLGAALVAVNYIAVKQKVSWDFTREKIFTLAPETTEVLKSLQDEVRVLAFFGPNDPAYEGVKELLNRYQRESSHLVVQFVDPDKEPQLVQEKNITQHGPRVVFLRGSAEAKSPDLTEEGFTNAIKKLLHTTSKVVYFVTGHGEGSLTESGERGYATIAQRLANEGLEHKTLHLSTESIPEDAGALAILGPQRPFMPEEVEALRSYLHNGGRLLVALEPTFDDPNLLDLLSEYGILFEDAIIVDPLSKLFGGGDAIPVVQQYADHAITKGFAFQTIFPTVRPITARGDVDPRPLVVAMTNPSAWGETDWRSGAAQYTPESDRRGSLGVLAALEKGEGETKTRIVAIGDADFVNNRFVNAAGNADLFLNSLNWLVSQEERITIRPKVRAASRLTLTAADAKFLNFFSIAAMPMLVLAVGLSVWLVRRSR